MRLAHTGRAAAGVDWRVRLRPAASAGAPRQWSPRSFARNGRFREAAHGIRFLAPLAAVPRPARHEDGVHIFAAHDLTNVEAGDLRIAAPFALAGHHNTQNDCPGETQSLGRPVL